MTKYDDMDNFSELIYYAIFLIISWALSTLGKKKKKKPIPTSAEQNQDGRNTSSSPNINWEDLVKQLNPNYVETKERPQFEEEYEVEEEEYEPVLNTFEQTSVKKEYEKNQTNLKDTSTKENKSKSRSLRHKLRNKSDIRDAFVLKEVLDRKF
ncbi:hypothetical protein [Sediminitomix flava]|uniref:Uncharacterized protein n=1 Tax=Sediminitomix flava TaxID=379075 RepID=A0A315Z4Z7_SEDFL|nr:hypothetical protein [Sediminitomix flava]PWJ38492.1 hypothetical protein BC781_10782 [Sediminitomix flava]